MMYVFMFTGYIEESVNRIETEGTNCDTELMNKLSEEGKSKGPGECKSIGTSHSEDKSGQSSQSEAVGTGHTLGGTTNKSHDKDGAKPPSVDEMRQKRLAFLNKLQTTANTDTTAMCTESEQSKSDVKESEQNGHTSVSEIQTSNTVDPETGNSTPDHV